MEGLPALEGFKCLYCRLCDLRAGGRADLGCPYRATRPAAVKAEDEKSPSSRISSPSQYERATATTREASADVDPLSAGLRYVGQREIRPREHVHGLRQRLADGADLLDRA